MSLRERLKERRVLHRQGLVPDWLLLKRRRLLLVLEEGTDSADISVVPDVLPSDNDMWDHQGARVNYPNVA